jgi:hypothetical protein
MRLNGRTGFALLLIAFGILLLLHKLGLGVGWIMGYIIPLAMVGIGYVGIRNGNRVMGWIIFFIGLIALVGKFSWLIGFLVAIGFILYGLSLLKGGRRVF